MVNVPKKLRIGEHGKLDMLGESALRSLASLAILALLAAAIAENGARAAAADFDIALENVNPKKSVVIVRLVDKRNNTPRAGAKVVVRAAVGPDFTPTMTFQTTARALGTPGRYVVVSEPGLKIMSLELDAQIEGEAEIVRGVFNVGGGL